MIEDDLMSVKE